MKIVIVSDTNPYLPQPPQAQSLADLARGFAVLGYRVTLIAPNHERNIRNFHGVHLITYAAQAARFAQVRELVPNLRFIRSQLDSIEADIVIQAKATAYSLLTRLKLQVPTLLASELAGNRYLCFDLADYYQRASKRVEQDRYKLIIFTDYYFGEDGAAIEKLLLQLTADHTLLCVSWSEAGQRVATQCQTALGERCNVIYQPPREQLAGILKRSGLLLHLAQQKLPAAFFVYAAAAGIPIISSQHTAAKLPSAGFFKVSAQDSSLTTTISELTTLGKHKFHAIRMELRHAAQIYDWTERLPKVISLLQRRITQSPSVFSLRIPFKKLPASA